LEGSLGARIFVTGRAVEEVGVEGELPRRSEWGERMMERGKSRRSRGFSYFFGD
jgi:hypothetical protein